MLLNSREQFGSAAIALHWVIAILFVVQIPLGYATQVTEAYPETQFALYQWHKSMGFLILSISAVRVAWWLANACPDLPAHMPAVERFAASLSKRVLLLLTLAVPLAGWATVSSSPLEIPSFAFNLVVVPHLPLPRSDEAEAIWSNIHGVLAYFAGALAALHALAALRHHFLLRDDVLLRMLGQRRR